MKPLEQNKVIVFDRRDGEPEPGSPSLTIKAVLTCPHCGIAADYAIACWDTDWPSMWSGERVDWTKVQQEPRLFGYTARQVQDIIWEAETKF